MLSRKYTSLHFHFFFFFHFFLLFLLLLLLLVFRFVIVCMGILESLGTGDLVYYAILFIELFLMIEFRTYNWNCLFQPKASCRFSKFAHPPFWT